MEKRRDRMERLRHFIEECKDDWAKQSKKNVYGKIASNVRKHMHSLELLLEPPTEEEVLTLLNKHFIDIDSDYFVFESKFKITNDLYFYRDIMMGDGSLGKVYLDDYLFGTLREHPKVLSMLSRFYER